jgi:hypothetical protein
MSGDLRVSLSGRNADEVSTVDMIKVERSVVRRMVSLVVVRLQLRSNT